MGSDGDEIFVVEVDTGKVDRLTFSLGDDEKPRWSPDGRAVAFVRSGYVSWSASVWVMDADGGDAHEVSHPGRGGRGPVWSLSGNRLAFTSSHSVNVDGRDVEGKDIFVVDADGGNLTRVSF